VSHLQEVKDWLAALEHWRGRLDGANIPAPPRVPVSVQTWLMDQAMELDDSKTSVDSSAELSTEAGCGNAT